MSDLAEILKLSPLLQGLKGKFTQKWKFYHRLLTLKLLQTSMCLFVLLNTKEDIWKNVLIKQISIPIDYRSMYFFPTMEVNGVL